jgi:hypothetical protein
MVTMKAWLWVMMIVVCAGCGVQPAAVPVTGAPADLAQLAGEWGGDYRAESGRSGSVVFKLAAGADTARGDVVMIPRGSYEPPPADPRPASGIGLPSTGQVLSIGFVRAAGGAISGELVPYADPECKCSLKTRFEGRIHNDTIEGTFESRDAETSAMVRKGSWKVKKKQP